MSQATLGSGPYRNSNLFSGYYLDERVADLDAWDCDEEAEEAFEQIRDLWNKEGSLLPSYNEDELIDTWIAEIVDILGHGTSSEVTLPDGGGYVDRLLFENDDVRREGAKRALDGDHEGLFSRASAILEAKQWDADFEARFAEQRSYRDASHQIKYYLERTPSDLKWGVLTDGKKWRLYGTKDYETQTYYEVDLPEVIESGNLEAFKYFYVFFRPEAFVETAGSSFLDDVWTESETAAQELGEDLQDNVFRALRVLGKGFVESNDLDIDPDDEEARNELKEQSLVLLYRLMFVLYAESRGLIDPDDPAASEEYQEYFSLEAKREDVIDAVDGLDVESGEAFDDEFSQYSSSIWGRLSELFELIDEGEEDLDIPPYNGGLFSREDHAFLDEHEVKDPYIAEVIFWLSTTENEEGDHVPADYADLDTRHLGSIYEGLLEHEFRIAGPEGVAAVSEDGGQVWKPGDEVSVADAVEVVDEGGLYVVNDEGERKATGAYYTPDYVVTYIVEETVDPLIDEIDADLREEGLEPSDREYFVEFWQEVKELTILDPAMGSGHFLTKATGYLTEQVMAVVREQEIQSYDEQYIRREISKECIYGVDLNGMAVELSKLSMWLETLAADQPLAFLDHHLKTGNSLVGSDITEVLSEDGGDDDTGQITLTQAFARVRQDTLEHVMELMADLLAFDNETLEDVKSMEELYDEIREDPLYQRLFELANVHTAEEFGCDVPEGAYEQMAGAIEDEDDWAEIAGEDWFRSAQTTAEEQDFFHWELEFPEVFFDLDGEKLAGAGFDAVVGNPPYISIENLKQDLVSYLRESYASAEYGRVDIYIPFISKSINLCNIQGHSSMIVPDKWMVSDYGEILRKNIVENHTLNEIWDLRDSNVFSNVSNSPVVFHITKVNTSGNKVEYTRGDNAENIYSCAQSAYLDTYENKILIGLEDRHVELIDKISKGAERIGEFAYVSFGAQPGSLSKFVFENREQAIEGSKQLGYVQEPESIIEPFIRGRNIERYHINYTGQFILYSPDDLHRPAFPELFENDKIVMSEISSTLQAAFDRDNYFGNEKVVFVVPGIDLKGISDEIKKHRRIPDPNQISEFGASVDLGYLTSVINSTLLQFYFEYAVSDGLNVYPDDVRYLPIQKCEPEQDQLSDLCIDMSELQTQRSRLNLNILDHFGSVEYKSGISSVGLTQPTSETDSILRENSESSEDHLRLQIGSARVTRENKNSVIIEATGRYRPDKESDFVETDYKSVFRITDLTETEADLIEHFVPVAVDEAGGFANFRETATKTNSLVDRLKAIELPVVDDVADDLENYLRTVERAEELDEKIEKTDDLIDEIVYELYGLTDEEIEIVEEAVN